MVVCKLCVVRGDQSYAAQCQMLSEAGPGRRNQSRNPAPATDLYASRGDQCAQAPQAGKAHWSLRNTVVAEGTRHLPALRVGRTVIAKPMQPVHLPTRSRWGAARAAGWTVLKYLKRSPTMCQKRGKKTARTGAAGWQGPPIPPKHREDCQHSRWEQQCL